VGERAETDESPVSRTKQEQEGDTDASLSTHDSFGFDLGDIGRMMHALIQRFCCKAGQGIAEVRVNSPQSDPW
jgi:hypothetical protein